MVITVITITVLYFDIRSTDIPSDFILRAVTTVSRR